MRGHLRNRINLFLFIVIFGTPVLWALFEDSGTGEAQTAQRSPEAKIEANPVTLPAEVVPDTTVVVTTTVPETTTTQAETTTTTTIPLPEGKCSEWFPLAVEVGWPVDRLEKLGRIMWAESRCLPDVKGSGSYGLAQMQYNAHDEWMRDVFGITDRNELFDPELNLRTALWLAAYAEEAYGCWSQPWYMSGDWC